MEGRSFLMRFYESKAIACALSLAMATSMALPIGAFAAVDDSGQTQHEQKPLTPTTTPTSASASASTEPKTQTRRPVKISTLVSLAMPTKGGGRRVIPRRAASLASSSLERISVAKNSARAKQIASIRCPRARSLCLPRRLLPLLRVRKPLLS